MDSILKLLPLLVALSGTIVYAENQYAKEADIVESFKTIQVERYQDKINYLRYKETHGNITNDQKWELEYYKDKKANLLKRK